MGLGSQVYLGYRASKLKKTQHNPNQFKPLQLTQLSIPMVAWGSQHISMHRPNLPGVFQKCLTAFLQHPPGSMGLVPVLVQPGISDCTVTLLLYWGGGWNLHRKSKYVREKAMLESFSLMFTFQCNFSL